MADFTIPLQAPDRVDPADHSWYFNPYYWSVKFGPSRFRSLLKEFDEGLEMTWHPVRERWCVWVRDRRIQHPICHGWRLIFLVDPNMLDNRVLHALYERSAKKHGDLYQYWLSVERDIERAEEKKDKNATQDTLDKAMEVFDYSQIKVSMCGPSNGSKFSTYHS